MILPLAPVGYVDAMETLELAERLHAYADAAGLTVISKDAMDSTLGRLGADLSTCRDEPACADAAASLLGATHVLKGRAGRMGSFGYLMLALRDARLGTDTPLRDRSWLSRREEEVVLDSVGFEVAAMLGENWKLRSSTASTDYSIGRVKTFAGKNVPFAMAVSLLPGAGFGYLRRYELAAPYFFTEVGAGLAFASFIGASNRYAAMLTGIGVVLVKFAEIYHTGLIAKRINRRDGFLSLQLEPVEGGPAGSTPLPAIGARYVRRF